jgi:hypothetical protein
MATPETIIRETAVFSIASIIADKRANKYDILFFLIGDVSYHTIASSIVNDTIYTGDNKLDTRLEQFLYLLLTQTILNQLSGNRTFVDTLIQMGASSTAQIMLDQLS